MVRPKILRVCHKFLIDEDGYDLELRELAKLSAKSLQNIFLVFLPADGITDYAKKNRLARKGKYYYHAKTSSYIIPYPYNRRYDDFSRDLYRAGEILRFPKIFSKILKEVDPEMVHIHGTLLPQFLIAALIARRAKKKLNASHNLGKINLGYVCQPFHIKALKYIIHNIMPMFSDRLICSSELGKSSFLIKRNIVVIPHIPLSPKSYGRLPAGYLEKNNMIKTGFKLGKSDIVFFYPSRYCEQKNQLRLVRAFIRLAKTKPKAKLILAGKPAGIDYFSEIKSQILSSEVSSSFCLLPEIPNKIVHQIYDISHCATPVSINEGYGRVEVEALQHGLPVLVGKGSSHLAKTTPAGKKFYVDPLDERSINEGLKEIIAQEFLE